MANIDIKKLFVKVNLEQEGVKTSWENATKDPSKIYFLSNGSIYAAGRTYGTSDEAMDAIKQSIADEIARATAAEEAIYKAPQAAQGIPGDEGYVPASEASGLLVDEIEARKQAIDDLRDEIMGGNVNEALDTLKEIEEWISSASYISAEAYEALTDEEKAKYTLVEDGEHKDEYKKAGSFDSFIDHVQEFSNHVADFEAKSAELEEKIEEVGAAAANALKEFAGTDDGSFPEQTFAQGEGVEDVVATNFTEYADAQAAFDADQNARINVNAEAITAEVEAREQLETEFDEHAAKDHVFWTDIHNDSNPGRTAIMMRQNHDGIFGTGTNSTPNYNAYAQGNGAGEDLTGISAKIAMVSKWNVVDFADEKFHTNIGTADKENTIAGVEVSTNADGIHDEGGVKTGTTVPAIKINDLYTIATRNELQAVYDSVTGSANDLEERVAANEARLDGIGDYDAAGELSSEYETVLGAIEGEIQKLDLESDAEGAVAKDAKEYVTTTISETDGIVKNEGVDVIYGKYTQPSNGIVADQEVKGIATVEDTTAFVKNVIESLDTSVTSAENGTTHVIVTVGQTDGLVKTIAVETKDIASNHEFLAHKAVCEGEHKTIDTEIGTAQTLKATDYEEDGETPKYEVTSVVTYEVNEAGTDIQLKKTETTNKLSVWGGIAKATDTLKAYADTNITTAIEALDLASDDLNAQAKDEKEYVKTVISETDGIVKNESVEVTYAEYDADTKEISDGIVDNTALKNVVEDALNSLWEEYVAE